MPLHPIGVVAQRTGLSQDVVRAWERRYGAVTPQRGPGGQRLYTDDDIERLRLLAAATRAGRSIGHVAALATIEIRHLVAGDEAARVRAPAPGPAAGEVVESALAATRALDAAELDTVLRRAAAITGLAGFLDDVAAPLLRRVGDAWHAGQLTPAHEHLASVVVHDIIAEAMRTYAPRTGAPRLVLATLAGERHVLGAALAGAAAAISGWEVVYLGADLPAADIARAARDADARLVAVSIIYLDDRARVLEDVRALRDALPRAVRLIAGGAGSGEIARELDAIGVMVVPDLAGFRAQVRALAAGGTHRAP